MFVGMIGACGSYILFISGVLDQWISPLFADGSTASFYVAIAILLPFPIALSMLRSYSFLSATAKFGVGGVVLALLVTTGDGILHLDRRGVASAEIVYFDPLGFPIFVGNACFLFVIHVMVLSQEQSMIDRTRHAVSSQFNAANHLSLSLVTAINALFAVFAYISFLGEGPFADNIVDALDSGL